MLKRTLALVLALVMVFALTACTQTQPQTPDSGSPEATSNGKLFEEGTVIKMVISSHPSWPYNEDWAAFRYMREATGADIQIQPIPNSDYFTKLTLMFADKESLPDILYGHGKSFPDEQGLAGGILPVDDNLDKLPDYVSFWNSQPDGEELQNQRRNSDGKIYIAPNFGYHTVGNTKAWLYRSDIFEKHSLSIPTTMDELYDVCLSLKKLYPDSYPLCMRSGIQNINVIAPSWAPYLATGAYYDFTDSTWKFGIEQPAYKNLMETLIKFYEAELLPPDYVSISSKTWEEHMFNNRGFITPEYIVRIDFFQPPARIENPDYTLELMAPPKANYETGRSKIIKDNYELYGMVVCNTGDQARIDNAFKLLNWYYTPEAMELLSWGKQGETYEITDGNRAFILDEGETGYAKYGFSTAGVGQCIYAEANEALYSKEQGDRGRLAITYGEECMNPVRWLSFSDDVRSEATDLATTIETYTSERLAKYMLGTESMSTWDSFLAELKELGTEELLEYYKAAYDKALGK